MKVLFVAAEVSPYAKVGGLADVAGSLPQALQSLGHDVRVVMPAYRIAEEAAGKALKRSIKAMSVQVGPAWQKDAYVGETRMGGVPLYMIGADQWFPAASSPETIYQPGCDQYLFFSAAVLELAKKQRWKPDIVHCHDWHTGMTPVIMRERLFKAWDDVAAVFTIHNLAYQGEFGFDTLDKVGLPHHLFNMHQLETYGSVNFLKAACVFSDQVNTVSPRYAKEIQSPEYGCRLDGLMQHLARNGRLHGIINGLDTAAFDPATDKHIARTYSAESLDGKAACKTALLAKLRMEPIAGAPLLGMVSRLSSQKGVNFLIESAERICSMPCQVVVQGLGDESLAAQLEALEKRLPHAFRFIQQFDVPMAQRIYAGSDAFLMPSLFEPCGLGQLIAMRYGSVPVARETGGLADTVLDGQNGFVFQEPTADEFAGAVRRARDAFKRPAEWQKLVLNGMKGEFGWEHSAEKYSALYEKASAARRH